MTGDPRLATVALPGPSVRRPLPIALPLEVWQRVVAGEHVLVLAGDEMLAATVERGARGEPELHLACAPDHAVASAVVRKAAP